MPDDVDYKQTILLPQTDFPMRANLAQREPEMLALWAKERVYERALEARAVALGYTRARVTTTEVLTEARALYAAEGYAVVSTPMEGERQDYWMEKPLH